MRSAAVGIVLFALAGACVAASDDYTSSDGMFAAKFPGRPKVSTQKTKTAVGELNVTVATYAGADGNAYMVSYTDFPEAATKRENHATLLDGIRDGVKGKDGKLVGDEKTVKFGSEKCPGREFTVKKEKAKQQIRFLVVIRDSRVYQVAVIGTPEFAEGKSASEFLESFELTK